MANTKNNVQPQVVTTTTTVSNRRGRRRRRRANRIPPTTTTTVRRTKITKPPSRPRRRRNNRPGNFNQQGGSIFRQKITATLGTVGSNQGDKIELEMAALLNPALTKDSTGANGYGPLQMYAANYNMWRVDNILIKLTPLVGASAVSGTAVRVSLNNAATPGSPSWSALGARKHKDTSPGKPMTMRIPGSALAGPKDGWFLTNTKSEAHMCIGGSIEIHTLGQTMSTYQAKVFTGPLFLCEMTAVWLFKNYNPTPGMMNLVKTEALEQPEQIKIHSKPGEPILISVPAASSFARVAGGINVAADAPPSEIIWQICDTTVDLLKGALPVPFAWLFQAGWWFVKRIANKKKTGESIPGEPDPNEVTFQVFQSISDAQNNVPCIATSEAASTNVNITGLEITQITPGNLGQPQESLLSLRKIPDYTLDPIKITSEPQLGQSAFYGHILTSVPTNAFVAQKAVGQPKSKVYSYVAWHLNHPVFTQNGVEVNPAQLSSNPYPMLFKNNRTYEEIGTVFAAGYAPIGLPTAYHWTTVLWRANVTKQLTIQGSTSATDRFLFVQPTQSQNSTNLPTTVYTVTLTNQIQMPARNIPITQGEWYLSSFVAFGGQIEFTNYGVPFYYSTTNPTSASSTYEVGRPAFDVGAAMQSSMALTLSPPAEGTTALTMREVEQLRQLIAPINDYSLSEYDNMPPLEGEDDEEQGAAGDAESQRDVKNWVEFGYMKRPPTPFSPIEEEEEDVESDLDDDDYAEPPVVIKNLLTPEAKDLYGHLRQKGLSHEQATNAAQAAFPHIALEAWDAAYHNAMADGLSPPTARDCAWKAVSDFLS